MHENGVVVTCKLLQLLLRVTQRRGQFSHVILQSKAIGFRLYRAPSSIPFWFSLSLIASRKGSSWPMKTVPTCFTTSSPASKFHSIPPLLSPTCQMIRRNWKQSYGSGCSCSSLARFEMDTVVYHVNMTACGGGGHLRARKGKEREREGTRQTTTIAPLRTALNCRGAVAV